MADRNSEVCVGTMTKGFVFLGACHVVAVWCFENNLGRAIRDGMVCDKLGITVGF